MCQHNILKFNLFIRKQDLTKLSTIRKCFFLMKLSIFLRYINYKNFQQKKEWNMFDGLINAPRVIFHYME